MREKEAGSGSDAIISSEAGTPCRHAAVPVPGGNTLYEVRATEEELDAFMSDHEQILAAADAFEREPPSTTAHVQLCLSAACLSVSRVCMLCLRGVNQHCGTRAGQ